VRAVVPLRRRPVDWVLLAFFTVNLAFVTYVVDLEQLVVRDPTRFAYPVWPPAPLVDLVHWWGRTYDPLLMARPPFWMATIWIDALLFGPFYAVAIYALVRGREWIRVPALVWSGLMFANVSAIMAEELFGEHRSPAPLVVTAANLPWWVLPVVVVGRFARPHPFTKPVAGMPSAPGGGVGPGSARAPGDGG
jgi:hypothetical protein